MAGLGHLVKGFIKGAGAARLGHVQGRNEGRAKKREWDLEQAEINIRRDAEIIRRQAEADRLAETTRHNKAMEGHAATRAARTGRGGGRDEPAQWQAIASQAAKYRAQGIPGAIANIKARQENGAAVDAAESAALSRWEKQTAGRGKDFLGVQGGVWNPPKKPVAPSATPRRR